MPLPFIISGAAVVAAGYGAKKGYDAKSDFDSAERIRRNAAGMREEAEQNLVEVREKAKSAFDRFGEAKLRVFEKSIIPFVDSFLKIKDVDTRDLAQSDMSLALPDASDIDGLKRSSAAMSEVVGSGVAALGAGGLAGLAAYGTVGWLGAASTGTAISSLSGVAATNATLAWFGGGSLAAGGLGMTGGAMILGGVVTGPVLAVGGMMAASKAAAARDEARADEARAELAAEEMNLAAATAESIARRLNELSDVLIELEDRFQPFLKGLSRLVQEEGKRQKNIRLEAVNAVGESLVSLKSARNDYVESRKGLWNLVKYFFLSNPYETRLVRVSDSFHQTAQQVVRIEGIAIGKMAEEGKNLLELKDYPEIVEHKLGTVKESIDAGDIRYDLIEDQNKKGLFIGLSIAKVLRDICDTPLMDEDGVLTAESRRALRLGRQELEAIPDPD